MKRPVILYLAHCYHNLGGVEEHVRSLCRGLGEKYRLVVLAIENSRLLSIENGLISGEFAANPPVWPLTPYSLKQTEESLERVLDELKPDLIHVQHVYNWHLGVLDQLLKRQKPLVVSYHDYYFLHPFYTLQGASSAADALREEYNIALFANPLSEYLNKRISLLRNSLSRCQAHIVPSDFLADFLSPELSLPYQLIEHGITVFPHLRHSAVKEGIAGCRFGFIGSKIPQKGWMELLKAFQIVREKHSGAELALYGGGQEAPAVASPGVKYFPAYAAEDLARITGEFDVGVIPSLFAETFSYTLSELWAYGKPVAVSQIGALAERVTPGVNGQFFQAGDVASIVKTLSWFLEDDSWRSWSLPPARPEELMWEDYSLLYESLLRKS